MRRNTKFLNVMLISALLFAAFSPAVALADPYPPTASDDTITGDAQDVDVSTGSHTNTFQGFNGAGGNDTLIGDNQNATGANGNTLTNANDILEGNTGDDLLIGDTQNANGSLYSIINGDDTISGGNGNDTIFGDIQNMNGTNITVTDGDDILNGNGGNDTIYGGGGRDTISGGAGDDELYGQGGRDTINGNGGNDEIYGGGGNDNLYGDNGNDTLNGGNGDDFIDGGNGQDTIYQQVNADQTLTANTLSGRGNDTFTNIEHAELHGGVDDNVINASTFGGTTEIYGAGGSDSLIGSNQDDVIYGGAGNDDIDGMAGNDLLIGNAGMDEIYGGDGNDTIRGGIDDDLLMGGDGNDTIAGGDGDDWLIGGTGNDILAGNDGEDDLYGGEGDDILRGGDGNDFLFGEEGNDTLNGGDGFDVAFQQTDNDQTLTDTLLTGQGNDLLFNMEGVDLTGGAGNNTIDASLFTGEVHINGQGGNDTILGGSNADMLEGGDGDDYIHGGLGTDFIDGGDGNDTIFDGGYDPTAPNTGLFEMIDAGDGDDTITTSGLTALITGWAGNDTYNFTSKDTNTAVIVIDPQGTNLFHFAPGTQGHYYLATISDEDTLDFSDYDQGVNVDLSDTNDQEVSSGLWLTLGGFFKNLIGTEQEDVLIGNSLDNNISGLGGNDQLNGNGGVNRLDGGAGMDEALTPSDADTHISIEIPSDDDPSPLEITPFIGLAGVIPVTGGDVQKLECPVGANEITLQLDSGDQVRFIGLCNLDASLEKLGSAGMPAELPTGATFVSDMLIQVLDEGTLLKLFKLGSIEISFVIPADAQGKDLSLLYWDEDASTWIEIPLDSADMQYPATLNPDDSSDQRMIYKGLSSTLLKAITQENFSGLFVLVAK